MARKRRPEELTEQELEETNGEPLPDREAMSVIRGAVPLPDGVFPIEPDPKTTDTEWSPDDPPRT
jgi:hypothetical protein